jgi:hypothetical protein
MEPVRVPEDEITEVDGVAEIVRLLEEVQEGVMVQEGVIPAVGDRDGVGNLVPVRLGQAPREPSGGAQASKRRGAHARSTRVTVGACVVGRLRVPVLLLQHHHGGGGGSGA